MSRFLTAAVWAIRLLIVLNAADAIVRLCTIEQWVSETNLAAYHNCENH